MCMHVYVCVCVCARARVCVLVCACVRECLLDVSDLRRLQAEKQAEKEASNWWSHLQEEIKEGKFNTYARVGGVANFVLIVFLSWTFFISLFPHSTLCLLVGVLVGFVELPFCCWCIPQCKMLSEILAPLKVYWIRGCGYIALAALLVLASGGSVLMIFFAILLLLDGLCYVLAHFKGESEGQEGGYDSLERGQGHPAAASAKAPAPTSPAAGTASPPTCFSWRKKHCHHQAHKMFPGRSGICAPPSLPHRSKQPAPP